MILLRYSLAQSLPTESPASQQLRQQPLPLPAGRPGQRLYCHWSPWPFQRWSSTRYGAYVIFCLNRRHQYYFQRTRVFTVVLEVQKHLWHCFDRSCLCTGTWWAKSCCQFSCSRACECFSRVRSNPSEERSTDNAESSATPEDSSSDDDDDDDEESTSEDDAQNWKVSSRYKIVLGNFHFLFMYTAWEARRWPIVGISLATKPRSLLAWDSDEGSACGYWNSKWMT